ncbi:MAG: phage tail tape measure protein [Candidatus Kapabacteria bacterium]|nr:phage tail tape measure protein [Ignavibacteriota bacterium]MCW5885792.1 phage tail tape measure protein [Candidatus Kapabacteria bacterium]
MSKNLEMVLDFMVDLKTDKSKVKRLADETEKLLSSIHPEIDTSSLKKGVQEIMNYLQSTGGSVENLKQAMSTMEINLDAEDLVSTFNEIENALLEIEKIDVSEALKKIDLSEVEKTLENLEISLSGLSEEDFFKEIEKLADSFVKSEMESKKLLETQKQALQALKASGKEGSEAYKKLEKDIAEAEKRLGSLSGTAEKTTKTFSERMATFGLATQGVQQVTAAFNQFLGPYQEFDKQLKNIGTLGVKNFEEFRNSAINLASDVPDTVAGVTEAIYNAISAEAINVVDGQADIAQGMKFIEQSSKLAVAGLSTTNDAVKALSSVTNAYGTDVLDAGKAADILFATVKNGVTTVPELNASLSQVVPIAAAAGVSFEEVGAAIATLTKQGVPTAQATTQIRSAIAELMKPGKDLKEVMEAAGVSIESLQKDGFQVTMQKLGEGMAKTGRDAANTFSSIESIGFALASTGDNAEKFANDLASIQDGAGSVDEAFAIANEGIAVKVQGVLNKIEAGFFKFFGAVGDGFIGLLTLSNQLAPMIASFSGIANLLPIDKFKQLGTVVLGLIPGFTSVGAVGTATGTAVSAAWISIIAPIAAIVAALAGLYLFFTKTEKGTSIIKKLGDGFKQLWDMAQPAFDGFMTFGESVVNALTTIGEAVWEYLITPFELGAEIIDMILGVIGDLIGETLDLNKVFEIMGQVYNEAAKKVDAVAQVFANIVKWIKQTKDNITAFIRNAPELFGILFDYAKYYLNPVNWISGDDEFEKQLSLRMQNAVKKVRETAQDINAQRDTKKTEEALEKVNQKQKELNKTNKEAKDVNESKNRSTKTALEIAKEEAGFKSKLLDLEYQKTEYLTKQNQLNENRNATTEEELYLLKEQISSIDKQRLAWIEALKAKKLVKEITPEGDIIFQPKVKEADKAEIESIIRNFDKEIQNNQSKVQGIKLKIDTDNKELDKQIKELQQQKIEWEVSVGIKDEGALEIFAQEYQTELALIINQIEDYESGRVKLSKEKYAELLKSELDFSQKLSDIQGRINNRKQEQIEKNYEKELNLLEQKYAKEESFLKKVSDKVLISNYSQIENDRISSIDRIKQKEADKLKELERMRENDSISEINYERRKTDIQNQFAKEREQVESENRRLKLQSEQLLNGALIEQQRRKDEEILNLEKNKITKELTLLEERALLYDELGKPIFETDKDREAYENLKTKLDETENLLKTKADSMGLILIGLQETVSDTMLNLFSGNLDAVVDSWRDYFNQLAGMLQAKVSAFVLDMILTPGTIQYLSALPFPLNIGALPAITQAVSVAVKKFSDPFIKQILSFPTGGKFDSPTLAIVGDGAKLGMPNREWLLNDPQLISIVQMASLASNSMIVSKLDNLDKTMSSMKLSTKLRGKDIEVSYRRTHQYTIARAR